MLRQNEIRIYQNTGNGMATSASQTIGQGANDGVWAPFVAGDNLEDLVVFDGSEVRAYRNMNDGTVYTTPVTSSVTATKVFVAQMDESIFQADPSTRFDLVSYSGSQVTVRLNDNNNGFSSTQTFDVGFNLTGLAIGALDNDGFNDIVVGGYNAAKAYHNNNGTINTTAIWSVANLDVINVVPLIGDMGTPTTPDKNDGWNDIVITGYQAPVRIFANNQGSFGSTPDQSFQSGSPQAPLGKVMLVDIQNTGGLSFVYQQTVSPIGDPSTLSIRINKHTGDPAPAPPQNVSVVPVPRGYGGYYDAKVTWRRNIERDLVGYELWRRVTGICGNGTWYLLAEIDPSETEYIDELGTVAQNGNCLAEYKLLAVDGANNESDFSEIVEIEFGSDIWKAAGGKPVTKNVPSDYALHSAFPNPFNPSTTIKYALPENSNVTLVVYDVLGREVAQLVNGTREAGYHSATWDASGVSSGVYFARFAATDVNGSIRLNKVTKLVLTR